MTKKILYAVVCTTLAAMTISVTLTGCRIKTEEFILVPTLSHGTLTPGTYVQNSSGCWVKHQGYTRFKPPTSQSYWWSPKSGYASGTVTDVSNGAPTANRRIDVMESGTLNHFCDTNTPGRVTFPIAPTSKYAIIVYVINPNTPPDSAGETLSICVNGLQ